MEKNFGDFIKKKRIENGYSLQKDLADKIGKTKNFISLLESNQSFPSYETCKILAKTLNIEINFLWNLVGQNKLNKKEDHEELIKTININNEVNSDFTILQKELYYEYKTKNDLIYIKTIYIKANRDNLNSYPDKYSWTGNGEIEVKSSFENQKFIQLGVENLWTLYKTVFNESINKGEIIKIETIWTLKDNNKATPFMSAQIDEPIGLLIFRLRLSPSLGVKQVEYNFIKEYKSKLTGTCYNLDDNGCFKHLIYEPKISYTYQLKWAFCES